MCRSGYSQSQREEVLKEGLEGYSRMKWRQRVMRRRINRPKGEGARERATRKLLGPTS